MTEDEDLLAQLCEKPRKHKRNTGPATAEASARAAERRRLRELAEGPKRAKKPKKVAASESSDGRPFTPREKVAAAIARARAESSGARADP